MNYKLLVRITKIIAVILLLVSAFIVGLVYLGPSGGYFETTGGTLVDEPVYTNTLLIWVYALLGLTALLAVLFAVVKFVKNLIDNPKGSIKTIVFIVAFALVLIVSWNFGSPERVVIFGYEGNQNEGFWAQAVDMFLYSIYALFVLIAITIVGSRIYVKLK